MIHLNTLFFNVTISVQCEIEVFKYVVVWKSRKNIIVVDVIKFFVSTTSQNRVGVEESQYSNHWLQNFVRESSLL